MKNMLLLREESDQLKRKEMEFVRAIEKAKDELIRVEKERKLINETLRKEAEEKNRLQNYVEKAEDYIELKKECERDESR